MFYALLVWLAIVSPSVPDCVYEDGSEMLDTDQTVCVWDASERVNGLGDSFVVFKSEFDTLIYVYADGTVTDA